MFRNGRVAGPLKDSEGAGKYNAVVNGADQIPSPKWWRIGGPL